MMPNITDILDPENEAELPGKVISVKDVRSNPKVKIMIKNANELMKAIGYTEHGLRHAGVVSNITRYIMESLGCASRQAELGQIAAYLHDIGNVINRVNHPATGACIAYSILSEMGMSASEISPILGAIGNHEESSGMPVSVMSSALIIADKSDVHYSRVQNPEVDEFDIHDRVNHAVHKSRISVQAESKIIELTLEIDVEVATVMEYFEIFLSRMVLCRRAAKFVGYKFALNVNGTHLE